MTTPVTAIKPSDLEGVPIPDHDGLPVTQVVATITKTGDGLSESMGMTPIHIPAEEHVLVLIVAKSRGHNYRRVVEGTGKDATVLDEFTETLVLDAESALFLDPDLLADIVNEHTARVAKARSDAEARKRAAKKEFQLPLPDGDPDAVDPDMAASQPGGHLSAVPDDADGLDHPDGFDPDAKAPWETADEGVTV